jgi:RNA polymerase sigma-70 factor (ECF subfamily)
VPELPAALLEGDRRLARDIAAGSEAAFERFVDRFSPRVFQIASRYFRQRETVEETAQDVFLKAFANMPKYRAEMPLEHWISRITVNACYDTLRRRGSRPETLEADLSGSDDDNEFFERLLARNSSPDPYWEREHARVLASQLLSRLAPAERIVLTLLVLEELSVADVASLTGWSQPNVKIRAFRARHKLRKILESHPRRQPS